MNSLGKRLAEGTRQGPPQASCHPDRAEGPTAGAVGPDVGIGRDASEAWYLIRFEHAMEITARVLGATTPGNVLILGILVLVQTLLSFSLDVEIDGMLPWRRRQLEQVRRLPRRSRARGGVVAPPQCPRPPGRQLVLALVIPAKSSVQLLTLSAQSSTDAISVAGHVLSVTCASTPKITRDD